MAAEAVARDRVPAPVDGARAHPAVRATRAGDLIDALIPDEDAAVRAQILERTDGNPLFLEEVAAALLEQPGDIAIPTTLQALFTARLDALDEEAKHTLQLASVIGRSFSEPVLRAVVGRRGSLDLAPHPGTQRA